jgi:hypothetical protein
MTSLDDNTKRASHGLFYMENAGGYHAEPESPMPTQEAAEEHQPSCFALEEERGEGWHGAGASGPLVKETRPTL